MILQGSALKVSYVSYSSLRVWNPKREAYSARWIGTGSSRTDSLLVLWLLQSQLQPENDGGNSYLLRMYRNIIAVM